MPDKDLGAGFDGIVKGRVLGGVLNFRIDVDCHAQQENDTLNVLIKNSKVEEVLTFSVHLKNYDR